MKGDKGHPEKEATKGEDCRPPPNTRNKPIPLGVPREFETEGPPPTLMQGQPLGGNECPAGGEASNQAEVAASTTGPIGVAAPVDSEAREMEDPGRFGRPGGKHKDLAQLITNSRKPRQKSRQRDKRSRFCCESEAEPRVRQRGRTQRETRGAAQCHQRGSKEERPSS